jgi:prolyl oligopeptidase
MKVISTSVFSVLITLVSAQTYDYPLTRTVEVSDDYFGTVIKDPYRWLENMNNPEVLDWFRAQADFTAGVLENIPGRDRLLNDIKALTDMGGDIIRNPYKSENYYYFAKLLKGDSFANLYRRDSRTGKEELFFDGQRYKAGAQIKGYTVNAQGTLMALKIQDVGSELCEVVFMDLSDKMLLKDKLYPVWGEFSINFSPDGKAVIYTQMATSDLNSEELLKNMKAKLHVIGEDPAKDKILASAEDNPELHILPERFPMISFSSDRRYAFLELAAATSHWSTYYTETQNLYADKVPWKILIKEDDFVTSFRSFGNQLFFCTFKGAPHLKIGVTDIHNPDLDNAKILLHNDKESITSFRASKNHIFYASSDGITQDIYHLDPQTHEVKKIETPGGVNLAFGMNPMESDEIVIVNTGWLSPTYFLEYDVTKHRAAEKSKWLNPPNDFPDFEKLYHVKELEIPGHDGVMIPLSIIYSKNMEFDGNTSCYITGYGGYGYSLYPFFLREEIVFLQKGGMIAIAHVRGGGEKGEKWHKAGLKATKPNTWKDFISCAEYLIKEKYTSPQKLIGEGTSAGGILIGRAMTERPDLFAVAINNVGMTQVLRNETTANGGNHIPEMGSVKIKEDIAALIEMDSQSKVKIGVKYPAVLSMTGINDARVAPWMPGKFAAVLQACSTSGKPVFFSVDFKGNHGANDIVGFQKLLTDIISFSLWQTGHYEFQFSDNDVQLSVGPKF